MNKVSIKSKMMSFTELYSMIKIIDQSCRKEFLEWLVTFSSKRSKDNHE